MSTTIIITCAYKEAMSSVEQRAFQSDIAVCPVDMSSEKLTEIIPDLQSC
jgi:hypothetical protein